MSLDLLRYYNEELRFLRQQGREFAEKHPQSAARLTLDDASADQVHDPHVERLIEAVAFLNARTRLKIDDDFPEVTEALLGLTAPQLLAPTPSMSILECRLSAEQGEITQGIQIPRGTPAESAALPDGEPLRFRTVYPVDVRPIEVSGAVLEHRPFSAPEITAARAAQSVLRIGLRTYLPAIPLGQVPIQGLRFYLNGQPPYVYDLYEMLLNNTLAATVAPARSRTARQLAPGDAIHPVGFSEEEAALPVTPRALPGGRMLTEYFSFPQKFLFIDVSWPQDVWAPLGPEAELLFFFDREATELTSSISAAAFRLGCTPVVNLYSQTAEPIRVHHQTPEHLVMPDARRPRIHEIYSIDRVTSATSLGRIREYHPFYSFRRSVEAGDHRCYWHAVRRSATGSLDDFVEGSDVYLSLVDLDFVPAAQEDATLKVETTCLTRDQARLQRFEDGLPRLQVQQQDAVLMQARCLTRLSNVQRPVLGRGIRWRLVSQLAVNGLSLRDFEAGADGLREILRLYNPREDRRAAETISGLANVRYDRATGRITEWIEGRRREFIARGCRVTLEFDDEKFTGGGLFLFASVLDRFLGSYVSINSFVQTVAATRRRGRLAVWPRRAGDQLLM